MSKNNRRGVLKKIGAATAGISLASAQPVAAASCYEDDNVSSCYESLDIRVWPAADFSQFGGRDDTPSAYDCHYALDDVLTQLENANAIGSGSSLVSSTTIYDEFGISLTTDDNDCFFDDTDKGNIRDAIYSSSYDEAVHVIVAEITNAANASPEPHTAYIKDSTSPNEGTGFAWVGTEGPYPGTDEVTERYKNLAFQETGHVIIDHDCTSAGDHALGEIVKDTYESGLDIWRGPVTPMATYYENTNDNNPCPDGTQEDAAHSGDCNSPNTYWDETHTRDISTCTIDAVKRTCNEHSSAW